MIEEPFGGDVGGDAEFLGEVAEVFSVFVFLFQDVEVAELYLATVRLPFLEPWTPLGYVLDMLRILSGMVPRVGVSQREHTWRRIPTAAGSRFWRAEGSPYLKNYRETSPAGSVDFRRPRLADTSTSLDRDPPPRGQPVSRQARVSESPRRPPSSLRGHTATFRSAHRHSPPPPIAPLPRVSHPSTDRILSPRG